MNRLLDAVRGLASATRHDWSEASRSARVALLLLGALMFNNLLLQFFLLWLYNHFHDSGNWSASGRYNSDVPWELIRLVADDERDTATHNVLNGVLFVCGVLVLLIALRETAKIAARRKSANVR